MPRERGLQSQPYREGVNLGSLVVIPGDDLEGASVTLWILQLPDPQSCLKTLTSKSPPRGHKPSASCHQRPDGGALGLQDMEHLLLPGPSLTWGSSGLSMKMAKQTKPQGPNFYGNSVGITYVYFIFELLQ